MKWKSNLAHRASRYDPRIPRISASMMISTRDSHLRSIFPMYKPTPAPPFKGGIRSSPPLLSYMLI